jgi:oligosaccharide repeat unit polymerase
MTLEAQHQPPGIPKDNRRTARGAVASVQRARTGTSTLVILSGLVLTYIALSSTDAVGIFRTAAIGVGLSLGLGTLVEAPSGVRALIRVDLLMLWVLYGLTFFEFLFPQPDVDAVVSASAAIDGTTTVLIGFAGLAVGRHLVPSHRPRVGPVLDAKPRQVFLLFVVATSLGYLHILYAVDFDVVEALKEMTWPRFSQAWSRGRFGGDLFSLLVEVGALIYLIPPITGLVFARSKEYAVTQKVIVTAVFLVTIYYGIASGTRNVIAVYVFTFFGAYYLTKGRISWRLFILQGGLAISLLVIVSAYMLQYRNIGFENFSLSYSAPKTVIIDQNMAVIAALTVAFPDQHDYLGTEIVYQSLIHPIPRALWPEKPDGLSISVESVVGTDQATIACTFVGEAYMSGGLIAVILISAFFGAAGELWNRVGQNVTSSFSQLLYASGFFCAAITMRSMMWMTVTMLPSLALWCYGRLWLTRTPARRSVRR